MKQLLYINNLIKTITSYFYKLLGIKKIYKGTPIKPLEDENQLKIFPHLDE